MLLRASALAVFALPLVAPAGSAQDDDRDQGLESSAGKAGDGSLRVQVGIYHNDDNGDGNPFLDERLTVIEPVVIYDYNVTDRFGIATTLSYDYVSSASIDRLSDFDAQSGASGDNYFGGDFAFRYAYSDRVDLGWHLGYSYEYDYNSFSAGGSYAYRPPDADAELTFSLNGFYDIVDVIRFDGEEEGDDDRISVAGTANWYQILSPSTHGEIGVTISHQSGFLETPYNAVVIEDATLPPNPNLDNNARGFEVTEDLPDTRVRGALFGSVRRRLQPGRALELGGRLYGDSWDIYSVAVEPRWYETLIEDRLNLRLSYRYYIQSKAEYFDDSFKEEKDDRTQDSDLGDFDAHTLGAKLILTKSPTNSFDIGVDYTFRSDGLDYVFGSIGWTWSF